LVVEIKFPMDTSHTCHCKLHGHHALVVIYTTLKKKQGSAKWKGKGAVIYQIKPSYVAY